MRHPSPERLIDVVAAEEGTDLQASTLEGHRVLSPGQNPGHARMRGTLPNDWTESNRLPKRRVRS